MSFSQDAKNDLSLQSVKKRCCKISLLYGLLMFSGLFTSTRIKFVTETEGVSNLLAGLLRSLAVVEPNVYISEKKSSKDSMFSYKLTVVQKNDMEKITALFNESIEQMDEGVFQCPNCESYFFRGVFLAGGSVSSPKSGYHLDITTPSQSLALKVCEMLNNNSIQAKCTERQGRNVVYLKDSEQIQDFLTFIGAQLAALDMMNEKIFKDVRNNENRRSNCETANIYRMTGSSEEQTRAIKKIISEGRFEQLPNDLKTTAKIRLENPFSSLEQIALLHEPTISKSGANHRLKKLIEFSKK